MTVLVALGVPAHAVQSQGIPFHAPTAMPLPLAENGIRASYQHVEMRTLLRNGDAIANPDSLRVGMDAVPVIIQGGVTPHTVLMIAVPYVHATFDRNGTARTNSGLGDVAVMIRQDVLANDFVAGNRRLAVLVGATLPTGETGDGASPLAPPLRLGAGMVNLSGQAVYSYVNNRFGVHSAVGYAAATGSRFGVRPGDRFTYDLALGMRLAPTAYRTLKDVTFATYLELNGEVEQPSTNASALREDTGGHTLFLSPGFQLIPLQNVALEASLQVPIVRALRGTQLAPSWSLAIGVRTVFYLFGR